MLRGSSAAPNSWQTPREQGVNIWRKNRNRGASEQGRMSCLLKQSCKGDQPCSAPREGTWAAAHLSPWSRMRRNKMHSRTSFSPSENQSSGCSAGGEGSSAALPMLVLAGNPSCRSRASSPRLQRILPAAPGPWFSLPAATLETVAVFSPRKRWNRPNDASTRCGDGWGHIPAEHMGTTSSRDSEGFSRLLQDLTRCWLRETQPNSHINIITAALIIHPLNFATRRSVPKRQGISQATTVRASFKAPFNPWAVSTDSPRAGQLVLNFPIPRHFASQIPAVKVCLYGAHKHKHL